MYLNNEAHAMSNEIQMLRQENENLKKKNIEYEAVEFYIMFMLENNCEYEDVLNAHLRKGRVIDGIWIDDNYVSDDE